MADEVDYSKAPWEVQPASSEQAEKLGSSGGGISLRNSVTLKIQGGKCILDRSASVMGKFDFVGIYHNQNVPQDEAIAYQWATRRSSFPYNTGVNAQLGLVAIYWSYDYEFDKYYRVCYTASITDTSDGVTLEGKST